MKVAVGSLFGCPLVQSQFMGEEYYQNCRFSALKLRRQSRPNVSIAGLLLLVSALAEVLFYRAATGGLLIRLACYLVPLAICLALRLESRHQRNSSLHAFYRNRLARCYLGASNIPRHPNPFTGFDEKDTDTPVTARPPSKD